MVAPSTRLRYVKETAFILAGVLSAGMGLRGFLNACPCTEVGLYGIDTIALMTPLAGSSQ